jgi:hypothetical protein
MRRSSFIVTSCCNRAPTWTILENTEVRAVGSRGSRCSRKKKAKASPRPLSRAGAEGKEGAHGGDLFGEPCRSTPGSAESAFSNGNCGREASQEKGASAEMQNGTGDSPAR